MKSSLKKDENKKIEDLKKVIELGKKLKKDTRPDEKKLEVIQARVNKSNQTNQAKSTQNISSNTKTTQAKAIQNPNIKYAIESVSTEGSSIIIDFNVDVSQNDIKFFKLNPSPLHRSVFDIKGYFKDALATKLSISGDEIITIGQNKPDTLRIVVSGKTSPNTSYSVSKRQIIINVESNKSASKSTSSNSGNIVEIGIKKVLVEEKKIEPTKTEIKKAIEKPIEKAQNITPKQEETKITTSSNQENKIDLDNQIKYIDSINNKIIVSFNKYFSQKDLRRTTSKEGQNFVNSFDIKGIYKYTMPTKLVLDGIDRVILYEQNGFTKIKIVNQNNFKSNVSYANKELIISTSLEEKPANNQSQNIASTITNNKTSSKNRVIVIDAGHGGEDAGAVGPNKRYEKVVNLAVTKYLEAVLKQRGYKVFLTRTNDKFIKVNNRTILANQKNADLFISIHANSIVKEKASTMSGIETFFLSPARSERAKRVAALENKNDIREMNESSKSVFLESLNRPRITASHKFAIDVQAGMLQAARSKYKDVKDSGVREGPFWVLVGAQMPSILIELGYISHPEESRRLYEKEYQQLLANGIANGIDSYFAKNP